MKILKRKSWGAEIWVGGKQVGCIVGLDPVRFLNLNKQQARHLRKYGLCGL